MSQPPPAPSMIHSAAYYEHSRYSQPTQSGYPYPSIPNLQRPQAVHSNRGRHNPAPAPGADYPHVKSSVSSGTSGSSAGSDFTPYPPTQSYRKGSQAERGLMEETGTWQSQAGTHSSYGAAGSINNPTEMVEDNSAVFRYMQQQATVEDDEGDQEKDHAVWVLLWLSFLDPLHCLFSALFSIFTLILLVVISPIRICVRSQSPFSTSLIRIVAPVFRHHLQMIYAPSVEKAHTFEFSPTCLILVHVVSPLLSIGVAIASWISAVFWLFAITMGNPDGTERRDDGRATVLMVRSWWEKYLLNAIRQ